MVQVADNGCAAAKLSGPPVPVVVVGKRTVAHHGGDVRKHTLQGEKRHSQVSQLSSVSHFRRSGHVKEDVACGEPSKEDRG